MITKIKFKNFQKHKLFELELDNQITTLIGETETGKTTIFRAFYWTFFNRPSGDSILKHGTQDTIVEIQIDDHSIIRRKKKGFNGYYLDGKPLEAIGVGKVPIPIEEITNIASDSFQHQLDQSFWLSETPGKIAKLLNKIVNLEVMDETIANLQSSLRKAKTVTEVSKQRLEDFREKKKKLTWVKTVAKTFSDLEKQQELIEEKEERINQLEELIIDILDTKKLIDRQAVTDFTNAEKIRKEIEAKDREIKELSEVIRSINTIKSGLCELDDSLEKVEKELKTVKICPVCGKSLS